MSSNDDWHGLSTEQWIQMWDYAGWRDKVKDTLWEIARCKDASPDDRLVALQSINEAIQRNVLPPDPNYPVALRDIMLSVIAGDVRVGFFARRRRKKLKQRLTGARWMLKTAYQFFMELELSQLPSPASTTSFSTKLMPS